jgi:serine/threonine-protein kinase
MSREAAAESGGARAPSSAPGRPPRLEKYELLEEIGHGGMATVYRALDPRLGREVAVKVIHKHLRENSEVARRFVAEARAAAKLRHPGIVEVYDVSSDEDGERFLVVELLRGTTLRKILQNHRDMPAEVGASIALELCEALEHAHASGIIHRDVKPENVLVELPADRCPTPAPSVDPTASASRRPPPRGDGGVVIKLTDFGIAKILDAQGVTSTGQVLGSPAHMAPEQIEGGEVDARTDVFALGVLLYECLVGHLPFEGKNPAQVLRRVLDGVYPPADRERATVGGRWARVVAGALARDAVDRTLGPAALAEQIRAELDALGVTDPRAEVVAFFREPEAYVREATARLVPRLVARGEAARRSGDIPGAAADFNRALALAPNDLAILRRVTSLHRGASRRQLARRAGLVALAFAGASLAAFGVTRWIRSHPAALAGPAPSSAPSAEPHPAVPPPVVASSGPSAAPSAIELARQRPRLPMPPPNVLVVRTEPRRVRFVINPKGARLTLDGHEEAWMNHTFSLAPGPHEVRIEVPSSKCCKPLATTATVLASNDPEDVQMLGYRLESLPATVSVTGPAGGQFFCAELGLTTTVGQAKQVTIPRAEWTGTCDFSPPNGDPSARRQVTIKAGEANVVAWPGS